jgi:hypothetical protein
MTPHLRPRLVLALALLAAGLAAAPARAQAQGDLRRENQSLRAQLDELQKELAAARKEIADLRAENDRLRAQLAERGPGAGPTTLPPLEPGPVSIDETNMRASPRALFNHVVLSYQKEMRGLPTGDEPSHPDRGNYLRALDQWVRRTKRELHGPVEWRVRVLDDLAILGEGFQLKLEAIDPETGTVLGDPFLTMVSKALATRMDRMGTPIVKGGVFVVKGTAVPRIEVNPTRESAGPFDNPRFIGPFAEYSITVVAEALIDPARMPARRPPKTGEDEKPAPGDEKPSAPPGAPGTGGGAEQGRAALADSAAG